MSGWVRTRRDSKAGFSFINVHDGSCFDAIQVVAPAELENYASEVQKLTTGCAVECRGTLVESAGRGQKYEIQASDVKVIGWVEDPDTYPVQAQAPQLRVSQRSRAPAAPHQYFRRRDARAACGLPRPFTAISANAAFTGSIRRSSPPPTLKAPETCSASARSTWPTCHAYRAGRH